MSEPDSVARLGDIDNLVAFFPGVAQPHRESIAHALLYAQLRAGHLYDFQSQWNSWIHNYREHLQAVGFVPHGMVTGDSLVIGGIEDLDLARFTIANAQVSARLARHVQEAFSSLGVASLAADFFQGQHLASVRLGSFQVMPCMQAEEGGLMTLLCSLRLSVDEHSAGSRRLILHFKGGAYDFAPQAFAARSEAVQRYLLGKSQAFITALEL